MNIREELDAVYRMASAGDESARVWLWAFHGWAHRIDDFVDEPGHVFLEAVDLCGEAVTLCAAPFFQRHAAALGPLVSIVAEQYRSSLCQSGIMADALRIAGNQVVLAVAYLCGGQANLRAVSLKLWPIVHASQF